ncbi:hypothetical protein [Actinomadura sp. DC4]|uniref:hypothetical protein n=1 Tax=Actinomadura sp. DC4 TaxID=3055069 RepID=UPI0025B24E27|nr:hypothetical protein [Actinomadura sp. DC4]MDN3356424.1 hypothetical protein [Actinomadura sp. DC4]
MTLTAPDPAIGRALASVAGAAYASGSPEFGSLVREGPVRALGRCAAPALDALAPLIAVPGGGLPLIGTGLRAGTYDALMWNTARCGGTTGVACLLAGLATVGREPSAGSFPALVDDPAADPLRRAVHAGLAVTRAAEALPPATAPAEATLGVLGVATTCALLDGAAVDAVLDVAASLMLTSASGERDEDVSLLRAGHACAAGRTAVVVWRAGITRLPGAVAHTLSVVAGEPLS